MFRLWKDSNRAKTETERLVLDHPKPRFLFVVTDLHVFFREFPRRRRVEGDATVQEKSPLYP
jgi:hypothetical protein